MRRAAVAVVAAADDQQGIAPRVESTGTLEGVAQIKRVSRGLTGLQFVEIDIAVH